MAKNYQTLRINEEKDIQVVIKLLLTMFEKINSKSELENFRFKLTDLLKDPYYGEIISDPGGKTVNSNVVRIVDTHMVNSGILVDVGYRRSHGGNKYPSIYAFNPAFWRLYIDSFLTPKEIFIQVHSWYKQTANWWNHNVTKRRNIHKVSG